MYFKQFDVDYDKSLDYQLTVLAREIGQDLYEYMQKQGYGLGEMKFHALQSARDEKGWDNEKDTPEIMELASRAMTSLREIEEFRKKYPN